MPDFGLPGADAEGSATGFDVALPRFPAFLLDAVKFDLGTLFNFSGPASDAQSNVTGSAWWRLQDGLSWTWSSMLLQLGKLTPLAVATYKASAMVQPVVHVVDVFRNASNSAPELAWEQPSVRPPPAVQGLNAACAHAAGSGGALDDEIVGYVTSSLDMAREFVTSDLLAAVPAQHRDKVGAALDALSSVENTAGVGLTPDVLQDIDAQVETGVQALTTVSDSSHTRAVSFVQAALEFEHSLLTAPPLLTSVCQAVETVSDGLQAAEETVAAVQASTQGDFGPLVSTAQEVWMPAVQRMVRQFAASDAGAGAQRTMVDAIKPLLDQLWRSLASELQGPVWDAVADHPAKLQALLKTLSQPDGWACAHVPVLADMLHQFQLAMQELASAFEPAPSASASALASVAPSASASWSASVTASLAASVPASAAASMAPTMSGLASALASASASSSQGNSVAMCGMQRCQAPSWQAWQACSKCQPFKHSLPRCWMGDAVWRP